MKSSSVLAIAPGAGGSVAGGGTSALGRDVVAWEMTQSPLDSVTTSWTSVIARSCGNWTCLVNGLPGARSSYLEKSFFPFALRVILAFENFLVTETPSEMVRDFWPSPGDCRSETAASRFA